MQSVLMDSAGFKDPLASDARSSCIGRIVQITAEGYALVDYPGNPGEPVVARSTLDVPPKANHAIFQDIPVLLFFERGDPTLPIITGIVRDTICPPAPYEEVTFSMGKSRDVILDGEKIVFDAKKEIVLRCGKGSVTLRKDGKIVVKGTTIINRASSTNKIKGASVMIN